MPTLTRITIYPIKSLDGFQASEVRLMESGPIENDRRWAIVDPMRQFVHAKRTAAVHPIRARYEENGTVVTLSKPGMEQRRFQLADEATQAAQWLSAAIGRKCLLIENQAIGFPADADASGPTLVSTASIRRVAEWFGLEQEEVRRRFRANLEIDAEEPFWEDRLVATSKGLPEFTLGEVAFLGRTACQRCIVPTRDSQAGEVTPGFARAFAEHRQAERPPWAPAEAFDHFYRFTLNTQLDPTGCSAMLRVGDRLQVGQAFQSAL